MWVFTETGFVSAVAGHDDDRYLVVRARDRRSLESLAALDGDQILTGIGSDYLHRLICERSTFARWVTEQASTIDYPNFKDRVRESRGSRFADALGDVWAAMYEVTDGTTTDQPPVGLEAPMLVAVRRDTGEARTFTAAVEPERLFARFLDSIQEGPDAVDVISWVSTSDGGPGAGPWVVEVAARGGGQHTLDVMESGAPAARRSLRGRMLAKGYDPGAEAAELEHLLMNTFLEIIEDVTFTCPGDAPFEMSVSHSVTGPWCPTAEGWSHYDTDELPFTIDTTWRFTPLAGRANGDRAIIDHLRSKVAPLAGSVPLRLGLPGPDPDTGQPTGEHLALSEELGIALSDVDSSDLEPGEVTISLLAILGLVPTDVDDEENVEAAEADEEMLGEDDPLDADGDDEVDDDWVHWSVELPLTQEELDVVEQRLIAGASPADALRTATGRSTFREIDR